MPPDRLAEITTDPLEPWVIERSVSDDSFGALLSFVGIVRDNDVNASGRVVSLTYSAHPDASQILTDIVASFSRKPGDPRGEVRVAACHRVGELSVGDIAVVVSVASVHRSDAFEVCREVVEAIKSRVPIWKKQLGTGGEHSWVGM